MNIADGVAIGVDFGTTNSVVAIAGRDGEVETLTWPSAAGPTQTFRTALMFWREGRAVKHVAGPEALQRAIAAEGEQRFIQSIKTHLASPLFSETRLYGERFTIERLVSTFLGHLLGDTRDLAQSLPVVSGRPVVFAGERPDEDLAVTRLTQSYRDAGLAQVRLEYEPLGAAYWYARRLQRDETVLVADFGGGTSDFSVLRFERQGASFVAHPLAHTGVGVAGDTFDYRIITNVVAPRLGKGTSYRSFDKLLPIPAYFYAAFAQWHQLSWLKSGATLAELRKLISVAETPRMLENLQILIEMDLGFELYRSVSDVKAALSSADAVPFRFDREGVKIEAEVTRRDFELWIAPDLAKLAEALERAIMRAGLRSEDIDAVFLTGGTSFVPAVRALFQSRFGEARVHIGDAFQSVAAGLALMALDQMQNNVPTRGLASSSTGA
ncbi:MAG TPA: Hsp70 family protein [Methylovirgula sp.]